MFDPSHPYYQKIQNTNNVLLVKDDVGKPKKCVRNLPGPGHSYGLYQKKDPENAGCLMSSWQEHVRTQDAQPDKDYRKLNKLSLQNKCTKPKQVSVFRATADVRMKEARGKGDGSVKLPDSNFIYGIPNKPGTPITNVVGNDYANHAEQEKAIQYSIESVPRKKSLPKRDYNLRRSASPPNQEKKPEFKLKRFQKVNPKVTDYMQSPKRPQA